MMKELFGSKTAVNVLLYMANFEEGYSKKIAKTFKVSLSMVQKQLKKFELGGIFVSKMLGKTRVFLWNPRYPFLTELKTLLNKALTALPKREFNKYYIARTRPKRTGKPI